MREGRAGAQDPTAMAEVNHGAGPPTAVDELRHRTLRLFTWVLLGLVTPILLTFHLTEWIAGRYDVALVAQGVVHLATCTVFLFARGLASRAWVAIACLYINGQLIMLHYGPTFAAGLIFLSAVLFGRIFFGWRAVTAILGLTTLSFALAGAVNVYAGAHFFDRGAADLTQPATWIRTLVAGVTVLAVLALLVGQFQAGLERSVGAAEAALARERQERADKERADEARRQAELALAESQRQELIGRIAAGAAHDLNNVLTAILGSGEVAELDLDDGNLVAAKEGLAQIREAAHRASALGRQLLSFSRQQHTQPRNVDVDELFSGLHKLLVRLVPSNIELEVSAGQDLVSVFADPAQLEQLVMNLVVNSRDAMPDGGQLRVTAQSAPGPDGQPGVRIDVADTGAGIPDDIREKMFDPFFTTKEGGHGTGLGLATVRTIAEECAGRVSVDTRVGRGTTFHVWLPGSDQVESEGSAKTHVSSASRSERGERVLVADDDAEIRRLAARMLVGAGYRVDTAQDGHEVLEKVAAEDYDLVVLDAVMPGPSGSRLVQRLESKRPNLRMLFSTGYDPGVFGPGFFSNSRRRLLSKPYRRGDLLDAVRKVLDRPLSERPERAELSSPPTA